MLHRSEGRPLRVMGQVAGLVMIVSGLVTGTAAQTEPIRVLSSVAVKAVIDALAPEFEQSTRHIVTPAFGIAAAIKTNIEGGEPFDVAILTPAMLDDLAAKGLIDAAARPVVARAGLGVMVKAGERVSPSPTSARSTHSSARCSAHVPLPTCQRVRAACYSSRRSRNSGSPRP